MVRRLHDVTALCQRAQRGLTRRSFLFLSATGVAGLVIAPSLPSFPHQEFVGQFTTQGPNPNIGMIVAEAWNKIISEQLRDNIFDSSSFFRRAMRDELKARLKD